MHFAINNITITFQKMYTDEFFQPFGTEEYDEPIRSSSPCEITTLEKRETKPGKEYERERTSSIDPHDPTIRTEVTIVTNEKGETIKRTKTYRTISKPIPIKRQMTRFGDAASCKDNSSVTMISPDPVFILSPEEFAKQQSATVLQLNPSNSIKSDNGGAYLPPSMRNKSKNEKSASQGKQKNTYVAPARKRESNGDKQTKSKTSIHVSNFAEDVTKEDLKQLVTQGGKIRLQKYYFTNKTDPETGNVKAFAFIHYYDEKDAVRLQQALDGYPFHNMILKVDWATNKK